ncbi:MAG: hypothetical protein QOF66_363 [Mycobacterium sp.]|jgi:hypothetical protein|uniref:hypothetical protein n=1 Tax=Mycobacterium sp. TaxID=1785 RepID=UPI0028B4FEB8|nr:hypothetical protein [Mycobacterium sp.]MDT5051997.1 hypothetical protein [Mycobacterium sp.]
MPGEFTVVNLDALAVRNVVGALLAHWFFVRTAIPDTESAPPGRSCHRTAMVASGGHPMPSLSTIRSC